jgi:hypothetical protein
VTHRCEDDDMDVGEDDIHDEVYLNMNKIENEIDF